MLRSGLSQGGKLASVNACLFHDQRVDASRRNDGLGGVSDLHTGVHPVPGVLVGILRILWDVDWGSPRG